MMNEELTYSSDQIEEQLAGTVSRLSLYSYGSFKLLAAMHIRKNTRIQTMGVYVSNGQAVLEYNPEYSKSLTSSERAYVLIHETLHILLHHCTKRRSDDPSRRYLENVAADLAVNSLIRVGTGVDLPRFKEATATHAIGDASVLLPSQFNFAEKLSFEQYLSLLESKYPQVQFCEHKGNGNSDGSSDNADGYSGSDIDPNSKLGKITHGRITPDHDNGYSEDAYLDDKIRSYVEDMERNNTWGDQLGNCIEVIIKAQDAPLHWEDILKLELGDFVTFQKVPNPRRWHRFYGAPFYSTKMKSVEPVAVYVDTSGSVENHWLSRFIAEIENISYQTTVYLWSCDTEVHNPNEFVTFSRTAITEIKFIGRGGTSFTPIIDHALENDFKHIVILTDGFAEDITDDMVGDMDIIWVITKDGNTEGKCGRVVQME